MFDEVLNKCAENNNYTIYTSMCKAQRILMRSYDPVCSISGGSLLSDTGVFQHKFCYIITILLDRGWTCVEFHSGKIQCKEKELANLSVGATLGRPLFHQYIDKKFGRSKMSPIFLCLFADNDINILAFTYIEI